MMSTIQMNTEDVKGNNPYNLSRMKVSREFRGSGPNVNSIQGYDAMGEMVMSTGAGAAGGRPGGGLESIPLRDKLRDLEQRLAMLGWKP